MTYRVRFTPEATDELVRLYEFLLEATGDEWDLGERALAALRHGMRLLEFSPFSCRKAQPQHAPLRELLVSFGQAGYVLLFEISDAHTVTVLAARHQRDDDYQ